MSCKYIVPDIEKKFIKDTTGVDLDAPARISHDEFMRLKGELMTTDQIDKKFAELAGICWHEWVHDYDDLWECKKCLRQTWKSNIGIPDFCADPRLVLEEMMNREDCERFMFNNTPQLFCRGNYPIHGKDNYGLRPSCLLDTIGKLALAAIKFIKPH